MKALLGKVELCLVGRQLCQLLPLLLAAGLLCQPVGGVKVAKLDCKVEPVEHRDVNLSSHPCLQTEPVLWITADSKRLFLEALLLKEMCHAGSLLLWHCWQHFVCSVEIPAWRNICENYLFELRMSDE